VVWDAFLSLYNTVVEDRRLLARHNPLAWILRTWERLACRAAHLVVLDTQAHGRYFAETFGIAPRKIKAVFVGAEPAAFSPGTVTAKSIEQPPTVLFYGQFIPLHGIDTVVRAAKLTEGDGIRWQIVGTGQEAGRVRDLVQQLAPANLEWIEWIPYTRLIEALRSADVCLGIFGATDKAARVIPNKAFQILMSGRPLITRDSPAIRELLAPEMPGVWLVPPADPGALADAVRDAVAHPMPPELHAALRPQIEPREIARHLLMHMGPLLPNAK
jgi:glycosyltransferase involved in cell wall biosynthesis